MTALDLLFTPPFDHTRCRSRLHQGLPAGLARKRRASTPMAPSGRSIAFADAGQRRQGNGAVLAAQPDQPRQYTRRSSRYRTEPYVMAAMSTRPSAMWGAAVGPGTPARPAGCTGRASNRSWGSICGATGCRSTPASRITGRVSRSCFRYRSARYVIMVDNSSGARPGPEPGRSGWHAAHGYSGRNSLAGRRRHAPCAHRVGIGP